MKRLCHITKTMCLSGALVVLLAATTSTTYATVYSLSGVINAAQEVPASGSLGTGTILGSYSDVTHLLEWDISFQDLFSPATGIHFHGPAPAGVNAGVQVNIGAISGLTSPTAGNTVISAAQGSDLVAGNWYVNIHTAEIPGGEIRGQVVVRVVPEPASLMLMGLGWMVWLHRRRR